jgi:hypothetical protein
MSTNFENAVEVISTFLYGGSQPTLICYHFKHQRPLAEEYIQEEEL